MKFLFFIIVFIAFTYNSLFSNWEEVSKFYYRGNCLYISNNNIFLAIDDDIMLSKDGGFHWKKIFTLSLNEYVNCIIGNGDLIVAGGTSGIHISHDNGKTWLKAKFIEKISFNYSIIIKDNYIFAGSDKGLFRSSDYGETWIEIGTEFDSESINALFVKDNYIFVAPSSDFSGVYRSSDDGNSWDEMSNGLVYTTGRKVEVNCFEKKDSILYAGCDGAVFVSIDNGENWQIKMLNPYITSVASFLSIDKYILLFYYFSEKILISKDNFDTYEFYNEGLPDSIIGKLSSNPIMDDEYIYIAYGIPASLYRMKISDISSVNNDSFSENQLILYPNPAKTNVSIDFIVEPENLPNISVELYNLTGILQSKLDYNVDYNISNGQGTLNCNIENIANGYYIIVIDNGKRKVAKPFIVNKDIY